MGPQIGSSVYDAMAHRDNVIAFAYDCERLPQCSRVVRNGGILTAYFFGFSFVQQFRPSISAAI